MSAVRNLLFLDNIILNVYLISCVMFMDGQVQSTDKGMVKLSASNLTEIHTTYKEPWLKINPFEFFCKWPPAERPEATKVTKIYSEIVQKTVFF